MQSKTKTVFSIYTVCIDSVFFFFFSYSLKLSEQGNDYVYFDRNVDFRISDRESHWQTQTFEEDQCNCWN